MENLINEIVKSGLNNEDIGKIIKMIFQFRDNEEINCGDDLMKTFFILKYEKRLKRILRKRNEKRRQREYEKQE